MENTDVNITVHKYGRYMGKFIIGYDDSGHKKLFTCVEVAKTVL